MVSEFVITDTVSYEGVVSKNDVEVVGRTLWNSITVTVEILGEKLDKLRIALLAGRLSNKLPNVFKTNNTLSRQFVTIFAIHFAFELLLVFFIFLLFYLFNRFDAVFNMFVEKLQVDFGGFALVAKFDKDRCLVNFADSRRVENFFRKRRRAKKSEKVLSFSEVGFTEVRGSLADEGVYSPVGSTVFLRHRRTFRVYWAHSISRPPLISKISLKEGDYLWQTYSLTKN